MSAEEKKETIVRRRIDFFSLFYVFLIIYFLSDKTAREDRYYMLMLGFWLLVTLTSFLSSLIVRKVIETDGQNRLYIHRKFHKLVKISLESVLEIVNHDGLFRGYIIIKTAEGQSIKVNTINWLKKDKEVFFSLLKDLNLLHDED